MIEISANDLGLLLFYAFCLSFIVGVTFTFAVFGDHRNYW